MKKLLTILTFAIFAFGATEAHAQVDIQLGPRVGIGLGDVEDLYIGADARFDMATLPVQINPTFDYYFLEADNVSLMQFTVNGLYPFGIDNELFTPYAGAGISIARTSVDDVETEFGTVEGDSDTDTALNLIGGAVFEMESLRPFVQAQFTLGGDTDLFGITGGLLFNIGG